MTWILLILLIVAVLYIMGNSSNKKQKQILVMSSDNSYVEPSSKEISEERVFEIQTRFEKKLQEESEFPDAIGGNEVYIYWNLMRVWFNKLSAQNRYNDAMLQKLRSDWLDYMEAVGDRSTYNYLSMEFWDETDQTKSNDYRDKHITASRKMFAIQDAFATAIGEEAVNELGRIQAMDFMDFSRMGELAPEGFKWDIGRRKLEPKDTPPRNNGRSLFPKVEEINQSED